VEPTAGLDPEPEPSDGSGRAWRAKAVIAASLVAIVATGLAYLHPSSGTPQTAVPKPATSPALAAYEPSAVDFVAPNTGWVVAVFDNDAYALIATSDGGRSWEKQLSGAAGGRTTYLHFFDTNRGVFAALGQPARLYTTDDGGRTWSARGLAAAPADAMSLSFVDPKDGWLLLDSGSVGDPSARLLRTGDGGVSWTDLGSPLPNGDQAFRVQFASQENGWLDSVNAGPYAYRSDDGGATWQRVALPAPSGGWPKTGQFLIAAHPTKGDGVVTDVINFQPAPGRSGGGGTVLAYPPLTVRTFDGGAQVQLIYATLIDNAPGGAAAQAPPSWWIGAAQAVAQAPGQVDLGSLDGGRSWGSVTLPADSGAIGYVDAADWWWIGLGEWSTSSDAGRTWARVRTIAVIEPLPATLQLLDRETAWFAALAGPRPVLETTDDGGVDWRMVLLPPITS